MVRQNENKEPSRGLVITAFIALCVLWGSTYLANLIAIETIPPFLMGSTRFFIAGFILYVWCLLKSQKTPNLRSLLHISFCGVMMLSIGTGAVIWVEQYIPSGITAVIVATVPLWFVLLDKREWKMYFSNKWIIIGLLIGFIGVLLLFSGKGSVNFTGNKFQFQGFFIMIGGSICWAIGSLYSRYKTVEGTTSMKVAVQMMAAGIFSFLIALAAKEELHFKLSQVSGNSIKAVIYLIIFGSLIGYLSYIWLLSVRPPSLVGTYAYVNPVVAVFLGWSIEGESISFMQVVALAVILGGVIMVHIAKEKK
ncbi:MAG: EamA family transporter [Flavisolibacter sp.]